VAARKAGRVQAEMLAGGWLGREGRSASRQAAMHASWGVLPVAIGWRVCWPAVQAGWEYVLSCRLPWSTLLS
jgi:elongation factor P hydroxylase